ncbi:hypothetical protein SADUNF_Sadunf12G0007900 [Salix dunnii]|uniref:Uncharacterized protein n=1 Tax=Salix dunnii TaxID=1413687 RepID=A0A835JMC1_9ROSI|nr:hypothetical protein SADUNF_Sadunf12G0007900 [Salix dunnii]
MKHFKMQWNLRDLNFWRIFIFMQNHGYRLKQLSWSALHQEKILIQWRNHGADNIVPLAVLPDRFESRKPLPLPGRGSNEISEATGIPGWVFVHMSGFTSGNRNYEGALALVRAYLKA